MISAFRALRNPLRLLGLLVATALLAACQVGNVGLGGASGPRVSGQSVQVAMLLPLSSSQGGDAIVARGLENAARMAAAEMSGMTIEISVYDTAGQAATAAGVARQAVSDGADIILGPLRSDAAAAVGVAVANSNVSVLSFSNNTEVAGSNVFVLGHTFANTANRMVSFAAQRGNGNIVLVHASNLAGEVARDAVRTAAGRSGATVAATIPYEFSQTGVINVVPQVVEAVREYGSNGLILTSDSAGALPFFAQLLPENGLDTEAVRVMGLTRWDIPPQTLEFAGLQGGWFALPDPSATADFEARYQATYGEPPHNIAALGYDGLRAAAETAANAGRLGAAELTAGEYQGANGVFRLLADGTISRAMAIAQITDNQVAIIRPRPKTSRRSRFLTGTRAFPFRPNRGS
ncbi:ABC-type branched-chain amino acid transport system, periplasmic component [Roseibacterium elongatum DSM 19469]|uniref:ABC-type branched-chain amino acid transport system, periplasmic component n=1 Tax=Roseicyclus elongatus DSM 19469 TaxID=1294273 RepID=W8S286_9RHOB|nr:penicillin-binding protein activator [Roseibacterium elongatum]AHM02851.1 ABC-type branched-chain amino acid transport system, periplasmic component [Roseibacterium elongatum DSM 19469]